MQEYSTGKRATEAGIFRASCTLRIHGSCSHCIAAGPEERRRVFGSSQPVKTPGSARVRALPERDETRPEYRIDMLGNLADAQWEMGQLSEGRAGPASGSTGELTFRDAMQANSFTHATEAALLSVSHIWKFRDIATSSSRCPWRLAVGEIPRSENLVQWVAEAGMRNLLRNTAA